MRCYNTWRLRLNDIAVHVHTSELWDVRHLLYGITQRYLPPDSSERTPPNTSQKGWYSINQLQSDGRLSLPKWLAAHQYGLPAHRRSPIQV